MICQQVSERLLKHLVASAYHEIGISLELAFSSIDILVGGQISLSITPNLLYITSCSKFMILNMDLSQNTIYTYLYIAMMYLILT